MKLTSALSSWDCANQRIMVRADLNVPLRDGQIMSDRRLKAIQPTLDYLVQHKAIVILATHIGRPKNKEPELSTKHLLDWFEKKQYAIQFCADLNNAYTQIKQALPGTILLLENLRFFEGEKNQSIEFAQQLARLAEWYVNDAFGTLHRTDTSVTLLAEQFAPEKRTIGFLIENELQILNSFMNNPQHPVCLILGGAKVSSKLPLIQHLLPIADHILLCPAIDFTFAKALGQPIGKSLVDPKKIGIAQIILKEAPQTNTQILLPVDYQVAAGNLSGPLSYTPADQFPADGVGITIGPATVKLFADIINASQTTFFNGPSGFLDKPETLQSAKKLLTTMAQSGGTSIVAGGDSLAVLDYFSIQGITHCLTGGGATLTYLSGQPLPGLAVFET